MSKGQRLMKMVRVVMKKRIRVGIIWFGKGCVSFGGVSLGIVQGGGGIGGVGFCRCAFGSKGRAYRCRLHLLGSMCRFFGFGRSCTCRGLRCRNRIVCRGC